MFSRYIGIDYSGTNPDIEPEGPAVYMAEGEAPSVKVRPQFRCASGTQIIQ